MKWKGCIVDKIKRKLCHVYELVIRKLAYRTRLYDSNISKWKENAFILGENLWIGKLMQQYMEINPLSKG